MLFCNHISWTRVNGRVREWSQEDESILTPFGGTTLEQAHNAEDSYVFGIHKYGSGMGIGKVEHKSVA